MELVKVDRTFFDLCNKLNADTNNQLLYDKNGRPCVLLVRLSYRGKFSDFVVPIKSNINSKIPRKDYLSLPPNSKTKEGFCHGLYYIKLFPIKRKYLLKYHYDLDKSLVLCKSIIDKNEKIIVSACQRYLDEYATGIRNRFTPDIDAIIEVLHNVP